MAKQKTAATKTEDKAFIHDVIMLNPNRAEALNKIRELAGQHASELDLACLDETVWKDPCDSYYRPAGSLGVSIAWCADDKGNRHVRIAVANAEQGVQLFRAPVLEWLDTRGPDLVYPWLNDLVKLAESCDPAFKTELIMTRSAPRPPVPKEEEDDTPDTVNIHVTLLATEYIEEKKSHTEDHEAVHAVGRKARNALFDIHLGTHPDLAKRDQVQS